MALARHSPDGIHSGFVQNWLMYERRNTDQPSVLRAAMTIVISIALFAAVAWLVFAP